MDKAHRWLFKGVFFINFAVTLGLGVSDAFFSVFAQSLGARGAILGAAIGFYAASKIVFSPFMGKLSDRFGRKRLIVISLMVFLLVSLLCLSITRVQTLIILRLMQGLGCAMFRPVVLSLVGETTLPHSRGKMVATFDMSFYGALSLGPLIGGIIMDQWGFDGIFVLLAGLCLAALLVAVLLIPTDDNTARTTTMPVSANRQARSRRSLQHSALPGLLVFIFGRACGIVIFVSFMPILLMSKLGLTGVEVGMVMASTSVVMTLCLRPMGKLTDRCSRSVLVMVGGTVVSLLYVLIPLATTFHQVLVLGMAIGLFSGLSQPASTALLVEEGQRFGTGFAVGMFNASLNLGFVVGPVLGALLLSSEGLSSVFYVAGLCGGLAVVLFSITTRATASYGQAWHVRS
ncbi:MFS transporter [Desulfuromonas acetoxidans]|uniref:Major facilitator superfamily MFS_1 n=1 Tax=Desulfuromonas acetoxidans (strain DSM 684 / 11070) TaxID=281689 RepID=Q1JXD6_DESA6|nr:MFS transporter [Desulfuromonas acetoxidans]EAT14856.1 major facilitator superfamily MFS_1 [Desulfuromonas acetoxidans DSM 684]MBF0644078.1 MFS transporter [Desulfuromonas acetoxidans]NVD23316.1 MFS transporter [Desulfuromonas acetoxidans]NVE15443.1 MFS transporter [Desulfuromonas acetoxidans]